MIRYILDTNAVSDFIDRQEPLYSDVLRLQPGEFAL